MSIDQKLKQGDTRPSFQQELVDDEGKPIPLVDGDEVKLWVGFVNENYTHFEKPAEIVDIETSTCRYDYEQGDTDDEAVFDAEWRVYKADGNIITVPNGYYLKIQISKKIE